MPSKITEMFIKFMKTPSKNDEYGEEIPWDRLEEARNYILNFHYAVYMALYDERLQLSGIKVPQSNIMENIRKDLKGHDINRDFKYNDSHKTDSDIDIMESIAMYGKEYFLEKGYSVKDFNVADSAETGKNIVKDLAEKIDSCKVCWSPRSEENRVIGHLLDAKKGGCKIIFVEKGGKPIVFSRYYFLNNEDGGKELFWDTIEGGDTGRHRISDWKDGYVVDGLFLAFYSAVAVAMMTGCSRMYPAEPETEELLKTVLKPLKQYPFRRERGEKIGIQPDSEEKDKPYFYHLGRSREKFDYLPLDYNLKKEDVSIKKDAVSKKLEQLKSGSAGKKREKKIAACEDMLALCDELEKIQMVNDK